MPWNMYLEFQRLSRNTSVNEESLSYRLYSPHGIIKVLKCDVTSHTFIRLVMTLDYKNVIFISNLKLTLERVCRNDERRFDLLLQILIT